MLNRRLLRIKVLHALYAYFQDGSKDFKNKESYLRNIIRKVEEEYLFLLRLPLEIKHYVENEQNPEEVLYVPSKADIETGHTFIYNQVLLKLEESKVVSSKTDKLIGNWSAQKDIMRILFNGFKSSDYFKQYISKQLPGFLEQKKLMLNFFKDFLPENEELKSMMEELYIGWNDDMKAVFNALGRTVDLIKEDSETIVLVSLSETYEEDMEFSLALFKNTIQRSEELTEMIGIRTKKWDTERIAEIDMLLMQMALTEMLDFSSIPLKVTINEYLEIAKIYSTPKSSNFLNGILDKQMNELKLKGLITKTGRGLVE